MQYRYKIAVIFSIMLLLSGCTIKKNTAFTRNYLAFTTRYNIYFNGHEAYKESLYNFEKDYEDNYTDIIFLHPVSSLANAEPAANAGFDRAIEKSQKAIRLRSMSKRPVKKARKMKDPNYKEYLKRGEYNPFLHNAWMLMGKSQFYKGDFMAANATFLYITRHFQWLPDVVNESTLWMARCYTEMGWMYEAENTLSKVESDKLKGRLKKFHALVYANYLVKKNDYKTALPYMELAIRSASNKQQKARMRFLQAQMYEESGNSAKAYDTYSKVIGMNPSYRTSFNAQIKRTEVMPHSNIQKIEKRLASMEKDVRNKEYLDQVYYAQGNLYLSIPDTARAIGAYDKAVEKSSRNGMEKAIAAVRLGDLTFARQQYLKAQPAYSTAISILPKTHKDYERINRLSEVLDKLKTHAETVELQDSLLRLANMSEAERDKVIKAIIEEVIRKEKEEEDARRREEYENSKADFAGNLTNKNQKPTPSLNKDDSWYFYNKTAIASGKTEFQKKWGSRKPEDNWRRRDKTEVYSDNAESQESYADSIASPSDSTALAQNPEAGKEQLEADDPKKPEYYLRQLPFTEEEQANANNLIQEGLYNMGIIFNQDLENLQLSISTLEKLDTRYPENLHKLDVYYEIYLMYMRMNRPEKAEIYKQKILASFPESAYATALSDPDYVENLRNMNAQQNQLYAQTYQEYLNGNTSQVHANYLTVKEKWPLSKLMPKFLFLHALSYVNENNSAEFKNTLDQLTALYGESDVAPLAGMMVKGIAQGRNIEGGSTAVKPMIWETRLAATANDQSSDSIPQGEFLADMQVPHLFILAFQTDSVNVNDLLFNVAKYNFSNYIIKDFDLEIVTFNELSMLIIKGFDNFDELGRYRQKFTRSSGIELPQSITPIMISDANFRLLLQGRTFADYFRFMEESQDSDVERAIRRKD